MPRKPLPPRNLRRKHPSTVRQERNGAVQEFKGVIGPRESALSTLDDPAAISRSDMVRELVARFSSLLAKEGLLLLPWVP